MAEVNRQWVLRKRPSGMVREDDFVRRMEDTAVSDRSGAFLSQVVTAEDDVLTGVYDRHPVRWAEHVVRGQHQHHRLDLGLGA